MNRFLWDFNKAVSVCPNGNFVNLRNLDKYLPFLNIFIQDFLHIFHFLWKFNRFYLFLLEIITKICLKYCELTLRYFTSLFRIIVFHKKRILRHLLSGFSILYLSILLSITLSLLLCILKDRCFLFYCWKLWIYFKSLLLHTNIFPRIRLIYNWLKKWGGSPFRIVIKGWTLLKLLFNWISSYRFIEIMLCFWDIR